MTLHEHMKKQREYCLKYEVNSDAHNEHWELLNYLCELKRIREENEKLINVVISNGLTTEL